LALTFFSLLSLFSLFSLLLHLLPQTVDLTANRLKELDDRLLALPSALVFFFVSLRFSSIRKTRLPS
jgi:hypothetical protein